MTKVPARRPPDAIALQILDCVEEKGEANKWDLIKVLGNEAQFKIWIIDFFLPENLIEARREVRHYFYTMPDRGALLHKLLKSGYLIKIFKRVSGRRLK